jgi:hypothetical protein
MNHTKKLLLLASVVVGAAGIATTGWAYWSAGGAGTATAMVGTWKSDTTTAVVSSGSPSIVGQQVTYTATVRTTESGSPTGNIAFFDGGSPIGSCGGSSGAALSGSTATCGQTYATPGSHSITAEYLGDLSFNPSAVSPAIIQVVNQASTTTSLTINGSPATYGNENLVVFTSTVSSAAETPTGVVAVKEGNATLCSITLPATTCSPDAMALNASATTYTVTAVYAGDTVHLSSTSPAQELVVNKATPVINWDAPDDITYGTALTQTQLNASAIVPGTFVYNPPMGAILGTGTHSLEVAFHPTDTANYESATAGVSSITVDPAPLTITASSGSMTYGGTPPSITPSYSGFVNKETPAVLNSQPVCSTTATPTSPVGGSPYASTCSGAAAANYTVSYVAGAVTVDRAPLTISASSSSMIYGGAVPTVTAGHSGFVNNETSAVLTTLPTCSTTAISTSAVAGSPYPSICSGAAAAANYTISYVAGTVTVNQASTTTSLTLSSTSIVFGNESVQTFTAAVSPQFSETPTGTVAVKSSSTTLCTITLPSTTCSLTNTQLNPGTYSSVAATYNGDSNFTASTSSPAKSFTVTNGQLHVSALSGSSAKQGTNNWRATVTVTVTDAFGTPVSGVNITGATGTWNCGGATDSNGTCSGTSGNISNNTPSRTWTISGLSKTNYDYDAAANTASSIVINKPTS